MLAHRQKRAPSCRSTSRARPCGPTSRRRRPWTSSQDSRSNATVAPTGVTMVGVRRRTCASIRFAWARPEWRAAPLMNWQVCGAARLAMCLSGWPKAEHVSSTKKHGRYIIRLAALHDMFFSRVRPDVQYQYFYRRQKSSTRNYNLLWTTSVAGTLHPTTIITPPP